MCSAIGRLKFSCGRYTPFNNTPNVLRHLVTCRTCFVWAYPLCFCFSFLMSIVFVPILSYKCYVRPVLCPASNYLSIYVYLSTSIHLLSIDCLSTSIYGICIDRSVHLSLSLSATHLLHLLSFVICNASLFPYTGWQDCHRIGSKRRPLHNCQFY